MFVEFETNLWFIRFSWTAGPQVSRHEIGNYFQCVFGFACARVLVIISGS